MTMLRVAWICEYPAATFAHRPALAAAPQSHPVPWVTLQAPLVARAHGIELHVVTIGKAFRSDDHFAHDGIRFHFCRIPRVPRALLLYQMDRWRIQRCLDEIRPDVVHGFGTESGYGYAAASSGYPSVIRIQGIQSAINAALPRAVLLRHPRYFVPALMERLTVRRCDDYVTPTMFGARFVRGLNPSARVHLIATPVCAEAFAVTRQPVAAATPELLFVGSIVPAKGLEILFRALPAIARVHPHVRLHVSGSGDESYIHGTLMPLLDRLGVADHVVFHGYLSAAGLIPFWSRATMLVLPTLMDTAPNVVAEAQVAGVPVVASRVGGVPEMVEEGRTGVLVDPGDVNMLADAIRTLLDTPGLALRLAETGRDRARRRHAPAEPVAQLVDLYRRLASEPRPRPGLPAVERA